MRILERKKYINKASIFTFDTKTSWKIDSLMLLELIEGDFIFTWIEDHICINQELFRQAIKYCKENNVDRFCYSVHDWNYRAESYEFLETNHSKNFLYCDLGLAARKSINIDYDHSLVSIQKKELLEYIWSLPVQRFDYRLTPLEAEISPGKLLKKTIRKGFFKDKFFASVDDDHLVVGSSLISQKRYPPYPRVTNFFSETRDKKEKT